MNDDSVGGVGLDDSNTSSAEAGLCDLTGPIEAPAADNNNNNNENEEVTETMYNIVPDPKAEKADLSKLRGVASKEKKTHRQDPPAADTDLENLAELVPDVKARRKDSLEANSNEKNNVIQETEDAVEVVNNKEEEKKAEPEKRYSMFTTKSDSRNIVDRVDSMQVQDSGDLQETTQPPQIRSNEKQTEAELYRVGAGRADESTSKNIDETTSCGEDSGYNNGGSDQALEDQHQQDEKVPKEFMNLGSSAQSISTATQTHEVRMPMYLPTFKPATGCTNASDFIVRCFVARLRSGITVVKHGRSRWCKSRLRVFHIHPDGRSLSWKPAEGEPTSSKRPPKLDLSTCLEVRHAWSPDPQNPMYTGTPILRQKCEAANAHKSFALIFKQRTVDITAVTADQCKVLMEGFSALCFRLQVANLAKNKAGQQHARPMPEEDGVSTTASATLTNSSTPRGGRQ